MRVPLILRIGLLVLASTGFYTYVGQMVPQKEVLPPQETKLEGQMTTADMVKVGREIMEGKGFCLTCHTIGKTGALRFPDLEGIGARAASRIPGMNDVDYLAQSMYEPTAYVVEGFPPGMPAINQPPIGLTDQEILCVIAYLQSLGGTPTVTLQTTHKYLTAAPAQTAAPGAALAPAVPPILASNTVSPPAVMAAADIGLVLSHRVSRPDRYEPRDVLACDEPQERRGAGARACDPSTSSGSSRATSRVDERSGVRAAPRARSRGVGQSPTSIGAVKR